MKMPPNPLARRHAQHLPTLSPLRPSPSPGATPPHRTQPAPSHQHRPLHTTAPLAARLIKRPLRPYTFTQLLTLSDGSTFTHRTTSPVPVYRSSKDVRNTLLWQPNNQGLANIEEDEAGRLRAFRRRFGRSWDAESAESAAAGAAADGAVGGDGSAVEAGAAGQMKKPESPTASTESTPSSSSASTSSSSKSETVQEPSADPYAWSAADQENLMDLIGAYGRNDAAGSGTGLKGEVRTSRGDGMGGGKGKGGKGKKR